MQQRQNQQIDIQIFKFKNKKFMIIQKKTEQKFCNCRNSKCMKLYCQCFAARQQCNKNCHCFDCHNQNHNEHLQPLKGHSHPERKSFKDEVSREHKGCACRKSGCTKKYCECYHANLMCTDLCKCIQCQNNESLSNKKIVNDLKRHNTTVSNKATSLYPIILTKDNWHIKQILMNQNPLNIQDQWIQKTAQNLYTIGSKGLVPKVIEKLLDVLDMLQNDIQKRNKQQKQEFIKNQLIYQQMKQQNQNNSNSQMAQQESYVQQEQAQQLLQNLKMNQIAQKSQLSQ